MIAENFAAIEVLDELRDRETRPSTEERAVLARWHGWGAAPQLFDRPEYRNERDQLRSLLGETAYDAAARSTLNAHFTNDRLVAAMWQTVTRLGIERGVVLEPGCGRASFLTAAPAGFSGLGIEVDPTTAAIAALLAGSRHRVLTADLAKLQIAETSVDVVIGNVPFGRYGLYDKVFNPAARLAIHDHFILKSLATLAPGGVAVLLTSRYTLDKLDASARRQMGELADFLGAVRLPSSAHEAEAGTTVVTDVVVFRRREPGAAGAHAAGFLDRPRSLENEPELHLSVYFADHPDHVLGTVRVGSGPFGPELDVDGALPEPDALVAAFMPFLIAAPPPSGRRSIDDIVIEEVVAAPIGRIERTTFGFRRLGSEGWEHHDPGSQGGELAALIDLRDRSRTLIEWEQTAETNSEPLEAHRQDLARRYERYARRYGPINRAKVNPETGRRSVPRLGGFRTDPDWPRVAALERYEEQSGAARPATILERRVVVPRAVAERAESPEDALGISLAELGRVDVAFVADLLDIEESECLDVLGERVFIDPESEQVVLAAEYRSGNVRRKLALAREAAAEEARFERNVAALESAVPRDVTAEELEGVLGAPWVGTDLVQAFAAELAPSPSLGAEISVARAPSTSEWKVAAPNYVRDRMGADHPFGTSRRSVLEILEAGLNGRAPTVWNQLDDGRRVIDPEATAAAVEKAGELREEFDRWLLHDDAERSAAALRVYNDRFNAYVPPSYADVRVLAPGLAEDFVLRPHQTQAIARMLYGGNTALWHPVGAGKTAEMVVGGMELRRLGLISRPAYVVPNHMLEQFSREFLQLYPAAEVLTVQKDAVSAADRHLFAARVRSHDWDAVVITHSSFSRWPLSPDAEAAVLRARIAERRGEIAALQAAPNAASGTLTKRLEKAMLNYTARLEVLQAEIEARQDDHDFFFDHSGVDYLLVDEAQEFKNGELHSTARNLRGVPFGDGSQRAMDLDAKLRHLRAEHPERQVTQASGTPVSNTVAEIWIATRYLRPDLLEEYGVESFDAFRAAFCDTTSEMELDLTRSFRRVERLARYKNLPELARLWGEFADVVSNDDLDLPRPELATGRRQIVVVPPPPELEAFISEEVRRRVDAIHAGGVDPHEDNMLRLSSECRLASFDWEAFRGESVAPEHSVIAQAAAQIAAIYHEHAEHRYQTALGSEHPVPGAFQLVFCDLSTPKPGQDDTAYERLRQSLVEHGVPRELVHFVHEHDRNDEEKGRFFEACREGRVAVAISSTQKMGMGTNVQDRLVAEHHLDVPWRPSDVEQREGRILRQGNQNEAVSIFAYATERSFSVYGWQTLERKAGFIGQLLRSDPNGPRSIEVHDEEALSYGEVKAVSMGDPDFLTLASLEEQAAGLERLRRSHAREQAALGRRIEQLDCHAELTRRNAEALAPFAAAVDQANGAGRPWRVVIGNETFDNRGDAARALAPLLSWMPRPVLTFPDSGVTVEWRPAQYGQHELVANVGLRDVAVKVDERGHEALIGALTRLTNAVERLPERLVELREREVDLDGQLERARTRVGESFSKADELRTVRHRLDELRRDLEHRYGDPELATLSDALPGLLAKDAVLDELVGRAIRSAPTESGFSSSAEEDDAFMLLYGPELGGPSISI